VTKIRWELSKTEILLVADGTFDAAGDDPEIDLEAER
jgi:hypothetical protein